MKKNLGVTAILILASALPAGPSPAVRLETLDDFKVLEGRFQEAVKAVRPAVVHLAIIGGDSGSGVIISPDGWIATCSHVVGHRPGARVRVTFADGRSAPGVTHGVHLAMDYGLVKISSEEEEGADKKPFPFVEFGDSEALIPGEWVIAMGHPLALFKGRGPVPRFGRVGGRFPSGYLQMDTPVAPGDSGGPVFDLAGRLVALNEAQSPDTVTEGDFAPTNDLRKVLDRLKNSEVLGVERIEGSGGSVQNLMKQAEFDQYMAACLAFAEGKIGKAAGIFEHVCQGTKPDVMVFYDAARAFSLWSVQEGDPQAKEERAQRAVSLLAQALPLGSIDSEAIEQDEAFAPLRERADFRDLREVLRDKGRAAGVPPIYRWQLQYPSATEADPRHRKDGPELLKILSAAALPCGPAIFSVKQEGRIAAFATAVSQEGFLVTKASELFFDAPLAVVGADGREIPAIIAAQDEATDLALLKIESPLPAVIAFDETQEAVIGGTFLISVAPGGAALSWGIVSLPRFETGRVNSARRPPGKKPGRPSEKPGLGLSTRTLEGSKALEVTEVVPRGAAQRAGVLRGDVIHRADGQAPETPEHLAEIAAAKRAGDVLVLRVGRQDKEGSPFVRYLEVRLGSGGAGSRMGEETALRGPVSVRFEGLGTVVQHDGVVWPAQIGSPVVDLAGQVRGLNLARPDWTGTYLLPASRAAEAVKQLLAAATEKK